MTMLSSLLRSILSVVKVLLQGSIVLLNQPFISPLKRACHF